MINKTKVNVVKRFLKSRKTPLFQNNIIDDRVIQSFLNSIGGAKSKISEIVLFGSRARGEHKPYSDYDILIVSKVHKINLVDRLYDAVINILLSTGKVVSLKIFQQDEFKRLSSIPTPFMKRVIKEGIKIG